MQPNESNNNFLYTLTIKKLLLSISVILLLLLVTFLTIFIYSQVLPPGDFPTNHPVVIESGLSAAEVANQLEEQNVVRSSDVLYLTILLLHDPSEVKAGSYIFTEAQDVFRIAKQITDMNPPTENLRVTLIEGTSVAQYADVIELRLPEFDSEYFLTQAEPLEGFLFPDTYYIPLNFTEDDLIELLKETYKKRVDPLLSAHESTLTESEIITLASIVEREANTEESMRTVAGILLNRLSYDMPLQADATVEYVLDRPLSELKPEDLEIDTPYNTYLYNGLPPTPIGNPGVNAIKAVLDPIVTDYFFYITGNNGDFYYAETFDEHKQNIENHLK
ncbi:MAG: endolytic transglycosylase MltG [Candidatus Paceibacterota bacterium]